MKYKKYIMLLIGIILLNINVVYADNLDYAFFAASSGSSTVRYKIDSYHNSNSKINCGELITGDTKKLLNDILKYPRYAVPAIIIVLGTLDMFKAVIAGKEDEMKKAQRTFVKRVIIGVAVFLVPLLVNVIIWFANTAWSGLGLGTPCSLN